MATDLNGLTPKQLNELIVRAEQRKTQLQGERKDKVREKLVALAKAEGYSVQDLFGLGKGKRLKATRVVPPKYRNPSGSEVWSGRGRRPAWFEAALKAGKQEKDLLVGAKGR